MNKRAFKDFRNVLISSVITLLSSVLVSFVVPKMMNVTDYGYYKTFTLYATYSALLQFGFFEGIYLRHSGENYENLNKEKFRSYFKLYFLMELILSLVFFIIMILTAKDEYLFIFICMAIYIVIFNISSFFQTISQMVMRFNEYSYRNILKSILNIVLVISLFVIYITQKNNIDFKIYIISFLFINLGITLMYIYTYKDIIFGPSYKFREIKEDVKSFFVTGFPLLISNLCSTLLLTLDRQFVNVLYDKETYAYYAFAYNLTTLVSVLASSISIILFPNLKKLDKEKINKSFDKISISLLLLLLLSIACYFPIDVFVRWFLPKYISSLNILRIIFPGLAITSYITVVTQNFYKTDEKNSLFFLKSVIVLIISFIANVVAYLIFETPAAISYASIISAFIWYIISEYRYRNINKPNRIKNTLIILMFTFIFYGLSVIKNIYLECLLYVVIFVFLALVFYRKDLRKILKKEVD